MKDEVVQFLPTSGTETNSPKEPEDSPLNIGVLKVAFAAKSLRKNTLLTFPVCLERKVLHVAQLCRHTIKQCMMQLHGTRKTQRFAIMIATQDLNNTYLVY